jgi:hypothetical protein
LVVIARWDVRTRSKIGAVTIAATMPLKSKEAPINPAVSDEYPTGCWELISEKWK